MDASGNTIRAERQHRRRWQPITAVNMLFALFAVLSLTRLEGRLFAEAIRLEHVEVPSVVAVGETAHLNCEIDLEQDELYSVKWYKDSEEFYEWKPKRPSPIQVYHVEGVYVDREKSHNQAVVLRSVSPLTAGFFRCEVSGERPKFHSVSGGAPMSVVILPKRRPDIFGGFVNPPDRPDGQQRQEYNVFPPVVQQTDADETIELNCTTDASRPAAQIRWFVNDVPVRPGLVHDSAVVRASSGLEASYSVLRLRTRDHFTHPGPAKVTCEAVIHYAAERTAPSTYSTQHQYSSNELQQHEPIDVWPATMSVDLDSGPALHQRRVATEQAEQVFRSRFFASPETSQFLAQRKEIIINVNAATGIFCSPLVLLFGLFAAFCII